MTKISAWKGQRLARARASLLDAQESYNAAVNSEMNGPVARLRAVRDTEEGKSLARAQIEFERAAIMLADELIDNGHLEGGKNE